MRVGVNCFLLRADMGGLKQYFFTLFDWLLENDRENEYTFFLFPPNLEQMNSLRSDRWRERAVYLTDQNEIAGHLSKLDVYFCPFNALWPRPAPLPTVFTLVDIQERFYPRFFSPEELYNRDYHYVASTHLADRVLTISEFSKSSIGRFHGVSADKILVAYLCADPRYGDSHQAGDPLADSLPFESYLLFPANRWLHKNHDVLLRALRLLREQGSPANLVITGYDVAGGYPVLEKAAQYGVRDLVFTAGYVTVPQMLHLYRRAEMLVFPSLFEGFGMPPVEAMAAGCPVASSNATCLPEICGDGAEYFDPADPAAVARAVTRIRSDSNLRGALIEKGLARARVFSPERMAGVHLQAFSEARRVYSPRKRTGQRVYELFNRSRALAHRALRRRLKRR
jgi:glycosyltransferase involved in cell wall biosynthesis